MRDSIVFWVYMSSFIVLNLLNVQRGSYITAAVGLASGAGLAQLCRMMADNKPHFWAGMFLPTLLTVLAVPASLCAGAGLAKWVDGQPKKATGTLMQAVMADQSALGISTTEKAQDKLNMIWRAL